MPISHVSNEIRFTGAVTNANLESAVSDSNIPITRTGDNIYTLGADLRLRDACDLSGLQNAIIELDTHEVYINDGSASGDTAPVDVTWRDVIFMESGSRTVPDRRIFRGNIGYRADGGGFVHNIRGVGSGGDPRLISQVHAEQMNNVRIFASDFTQEEVDIQFVASGIFNNLEARKVTSIAPRGNTVRTWFRNLVLSSDVKAHGGQMAPLRLSSMMVENLDNSPYSSAAGAAGSWINLWNDISPVTDNYLIMLGTAATFAEGRNYGTGDIAGRRNQFHLIGGGIRYYQVLGGEGATVRYYDNRSSTAPQRHIPTTANAEMLEAATSQTVGSDELARVLVRAWLVDSTTSWARTAATGQTITVYRYGKVLLDIDASADAKQVIGAHDSPAPVLLVDDPLISESTKATVDAYTRLETTEKVYDRIKAEKVDDPLFGGLGDGLVTRVGDVLDAGSRDVLLSPATTTAGDPALIQSSGRLAIRVGPTFTGSVRTTGTITATGVNVSGYLRDSTGIVISVGGLPAGHDAVIGVWPQADGVNDRDNITNAEVAHLRRDDISITASTRTVSTAAGDFSVFEPGVTVDVFGFTTAANNGQFTVDSVAADNLSMVLSRDSGSFVDEAAGDDVVIFDASTASLRVKVDNDTDYYLVADGVSYLRSTPVRFNSGTNAALEVGLRKIVDAAGNDLIPPHSELTAAQKAQCDLIDYDVSADEIAFGGTAAIQAFEFAPVARAIEIGQSSAAAMANPYVCIIQTGSFTLEAGSGRMLKRKSGLAASIVPDLSAFRFTRIGSTSVKDFVDFDNGAIIVDNGPPAIVTSAGGGGSTTIAQADFDALMAALPSGTVDAFKTDISAIVAAIQAMDASGVAGTQTIAGQLDSILGRLVNGTFGVEAIKNAVDALPTLAQMQAADFSGAAGTQPLATVLDHITQFLGHGTHGLSAIRTALDAKPDASANGAAALAAIQAWAVLNNVTFEEAFIAMLANMCGPAAASGSNNETMTYSDPVSGGAARVRQTVSDPDGTRTGELL